MIGYDNITTWILSVGEVIGDFVRRRFGVICIVGAGCVSVSITMETSDTRATNNIVPRVINDNRQSRRRVAETIGRRERFGLAEIVSAVRNSNNRIIFPKVVPSFWPAHRAPVSFQ